MELQISINGAVLYPTKEQEAVILQSIYNIVFGGGKVVGVTDSKPVADGGEQPVKRKYTKRAYGKRRKTMVFWTPEEINFVKNRRLEGMKYRKIANELFRVFGTKRTAGAMYQMLQSKAKEKPVNPDEVVLSNEPPLRANEWGAEARGDLKAQDITV